MLVVVLAGAARVGQVRVEYGEWALAPSSSPPRLVLDGRVYHRSPVPLDGVPADDVVVGHAAGGEVLGALTSRGDRTAVVLRTGGRTTGYDLSGGP